MTDVALAAVRGADRRRGRRLERFLARMNGTEHSGNLAMTMIIYRTIALSHYRPISLSHYRTIALSHYCTIALSTHNVIIPTPIVISAFFVRHATTIASSPASKRRLASDTSSWLL
jgi:hypothetical protein